MAKIKKLMQHFLKSIIFTLPLTVDSLIIDRINFLKHKKRLILKISLIFLNIIY